MIRPSADRGDVVAYDFRRPSRISADRQRNLEASHEQLAQAIQRWVSGRLRAAFEVHLESVGQAPYAAFVDSLTDPGATFLYDITNRPGTMMAVYLDPRIAFLLVERLLGGSTITDVPDRPLSLLESVVSRIVTDRVTKEVTHVWKDHMDLQLEFARFESARELIEMTVRDEDVLVTTLQVHFEDLKGVIQFALPFPVLESFFAPAPSVRTMVAAERPAGERAQEKNRIEETVRRAHVVVSARLPEVRTTLGHLARLRPGDVIPLPGSASEAVDVFVADKMRFKGRQGRLGARLGVQITEITASD